VSNITIALLLQDRCKSSVLPNTESCCLLLQALLWDLVILLLIAYLCIVLPFAIAFDINYVSCQLIVLAELATSPLQGSEHKISAADQCLLYACSLLNASEGQFVAEGQFVSVCLVLDSILLLL
jgi:hypothetical protein